MKKLMKLIRILIIYPILIIGAIGLYSIYVEPRLLISKNNNINIDVKNESQIKIVQFTDTQLGEFYSIADLEKAIEKINEQNPDIVVFTGDLIDNAAKYDDLYNVSEVLSKVEAKYGKFAIYGNHDYGGGAVRHYEGIMNESGFKVLVNSSEKININGVNVNILGADDALMGNFDVEDTITGIDKNDINILLAHEPDLADYFVEYPVDLILSGHSHGGQVWIPFMGPIVKNELSKTYTKGLYQLKNEHNTNVFVSSGLGNTKLPFRMFNIPEIVVFNIG